VNGECTLWKSALENELSNGSGVVPLLNRAGETDRITGEPVGWIGEKIDLALE
jgi:hypothetical protein